MGRSPCCDKANVKKGPWSPEEDAKLKQYIKKSGACGNWIALPQKAGLRRCGKSCRLRWLNYLRPNIKHGEFSCEEDRVICTLFAAIGSRWSIIASHLPGRTDNDIKNYWNTKLKKKLMSTGLAPHHNHQYPSHVQKPSLQSSFPSNPCQNPSLSSMFAENYNNLNPLCMTSTAPASTLDFTSAMPNFSNDNPSSSSVTTENSLLMNPSVYYPVKDNMLVLGSEGSSNSSSEHCIKQETVMDFHNYFVGSRNEVQPSIDDDDQGFVGTGYGFQGSNQANNFWADKLENANFGENVLKYDIEDIKKLIHSTDVLRTPSSASAKVEDEEKDMFYF